MVLTRRGRTGWRVFDPSLERWIDNDLPSNKGEKTIIGSKGRRTKPHKLEIARQILGNASGCLKPKVPGRACPEVKMWVAVQLEGSHTTY